MTILIIGGGGREHALARKFHLDDPAVALHAAPGNPGMAKICTCHSTNPQDPTVMVDLARQVGANLVVVGPEEPLTHGVADAMRAAGIPCFGPSAAAAQLEASKNFAKDAMIEAGVPTARAEVFETAEQALAALGNWPAQLVVKADGLAAGKGVVVCQNHAEAEAGIAALAALKQPLLIEEFLEGEEVSFFALVEGNHVVPLTTAQDHKRVGEGETGPNTGGMGAYSPAKLPDELSPQTLADLTVQPVADLMVARGTPFSGVMFVGLMLTQAGPKVLEYNVRFGDPECQVLMPRLATKLATLLTQVMAGEDPDLTWHKGSALGLVLAADGYPNSPRKGDAISLPADDAVQAAHLVHAGTRQDGEVLLTNGGRVLNAVGTGSNLQEARDAAYALAKRVSWEGMFYRADIGWRAL